MSEWKKYTGSDEQIDEIENSKGGFILRSLDVCEIPVMVENPYIFQFGKDFDSTLDLKEYLGVFLDNAYFFLCNPHPLADMVCQQARTGQPVYVKLSDIPNSMYTHFINTFSLVLERPCYSVYVTNKPDWNIPNAEYSFTEFKEEV